MLSMVVITDNANITGLSQSGIALIPTFVVFDYLKKNKAHTILAALGVISVLLPLSDAHKFSTMEHVTVGMYAWFTPMLILMLFITYKGASEKHNKSLKQTD